MRKRRLEEVSEAEELTGERTKVEIFFKRFTLNQRVQHWAMIATFMVLVVSGMPIKFPDAWWSPVIINLLGGFEMRTLIHHYAGLALVILGIYHVAYHIFVDKGSLFERKIMPTLTDVKDFWQTMLFYFGKADHPKYGRFSWKEKFDYWGAFWGMVMMGVTGLIMMFPFVAMNYLPYAYVHLATIVHTDEALLATLFIFIVHLWNVHFSPEVFPMSKTWLTGKISEEQMKHEHPLEYIMISKEEREGGALKEDLRPTIIGGISALKGNIQILTKERVSVGVILALTGLFGLGAGTLGFGMMGARYGYSPISIVILAVFLGITLLGIYIIYNALKK